MKINFIQSFEDDVAVICGVYADVSKTFFQYHNFLILPYPVKNHIYLPDLDFHVSGAVTYKSSYHKLSQNKNITEKISRQLEEYRFPKTIPVEEVRSEFFEIDKELTKRINNVFPFLYRSIEKLTVTITPFGAAKAFDYRTVGNRYEIFVWVRSSGVTMNEVISSTIWAIVSCYVLILTKIPDELSGRWRTRQDIVDFIVNNCLNIKKGRYNQTVMKNLFIRDLPDKLVEDSRTFLIKLRSGEKIDKVVRNNGIFYVNGQKLSMLTRKETIFLSALYERRNNYISKDEIYTKLHDDTDKTDWSVSKLLERLRKKLLNYSYNRNIIKTSRGVGYKLICE